MHKKNPEKRSGIFHSLTYGGNTMKKIMLVFAVVVLSLVVSFGSSAETTILQIYSGSTGTTAAVNGPVIYAPFIVQSAGCDIKTTLTSTVTVLFKGGNAYKGVETFDANGLTTMVTCTTGKCNVQFTKTFAAMQSVLTSSLSTTQNVDISCSVR